MQLICDTLKNMNDAVKEDFIESADLVVFGMHSKKGLIDFAIGSLGKTLIERSDTSLLLGQ